KRDWSSDLSGARLIGGKDHWNALGFGAGLNARGAMEIIIAMIGLRLGVLSQDMYSIIVVMAMATSMMAPTALRWVLGHVKSDKEEEERLEQEKLQEESMVAGIHRVLLPVRCREEKLTDKDFHSVEAKILDVLGSRRERSLTLITITRRDKEICQNFLDELSDKFSEMEVITKVVDDANVGDAILDEAKKDYDLLVLGATEAQPNSAHMFSSVVDYIVRVAPCPTMVVQGAKAGIGWSPKRILVPTNGAQPAKDAADVAFTLAAADPTREVAVLNVIFD